MCENLECDQQPPICDALFDSSKCSDPIVTSFCPKLCGLCGNGESSCKELICENGGEFQIDSCSCNCKYYLIFVFDACVCVYSTCN